MKLNKIAVLVAGLSVTGFAYALENQLDLLSDFQVNVGTVNVAPYSSASGNDMRIHGIGGAGADSFNFNYKPIAVADSGLRNSGAASINGSFNGNTHNGSSYTSYDVTNAIAPSILADSNVGSSIASTVNLNVNLRDITP